MTQAQGHGKVTLSIARSDASTIPATRLPPEPGAERTAETRPFPPTEVTEPAAPRPERRRRPAEPAEPADDRPLPPPD